MGSASGYGDRLKLLKSGSLLSAHHPRSCPEITSFNICPSVPSVASSGLSPFAIASGSIAVVAAVGWFTASGGRFTLALALSRAHGLAGAPVPRCLRVHQQHISKTDQSHWWVMVIIKITEMLRTVFTINTPLPVISAYVSRCSPLDKSYRCRSQYAAL